MFEFLRQRRREKLLRQPLPPHWREVLPREMRLFEKLPDSLQEELVHKTRVLMAEKSFEGCGGFELTEPVRLTVAAHAALLLLNRQTRYYPLLKTILIYPDAFIARHEEEDENGLVWEVDEEQEGQSWTLGAVVLSWKDVLRDKRVLNGRNVLIHEFAHQLYDGAEFFLGDASRRDEWVKVFEDHFTRHAQAVARGQQTFLDEYGAEDEAEFFSVASETFFEQPLRLRERHPQLYDALQLCYQQNPCSYFSRA